MNKMNKKLLTGIAIACAAALPSLALASTVVFSDSFATVSSVTQTVPSGWTVTDGSVDTIAVGNIWGLSCQSDGCVDLDGSTNNAGVLSKTFDLVAGTSYTLSFQLSGNQRGGSDQVDVSFGTAHGSWTLASSSTWSAYSLLLTPATSGAVTLSFANKGGDNIGVLLDNVSVTAVPEPETYAMMMAGLGLMGFMARRRKQAA